MAGESKSNTECTKRKISIPDLCGNTKKVYSASAPTSPLGLRKPTSVKRHNCLCSPTTHAGSFRCRYHRNLKLQGLPPESTSPSTCIPAWHQEQSTLGTSQCLYCFLLLFDSNKQSHRSIEFIFMRFSHMYIIARVLCIHKKASPVTSCTIRERLHHHSKFRTRC